MSTQHPDNVNSPFFAEDPEFGGDDEIQEAYYVFSHLDCYEQMWDCEGKEVDNFVIKKLLSKYGSFFKDNRLGRDLFLTLRVPNPTVEKSEAKILLETLESIPRSFDTAKLFYQDDIPPIFEVILPMTSSSKCLDRVNSYYSNFVIGKQNKIFRKGDVTIADWIGEFKPEKINVIPLIEDMYHMLNAHNITREYLKNKKLEYQRVFLARSDPAMNYGIISAVLLNKIALQRINLLEEEFGTKIYPIIGVGSAPFRGNLKPSTVDRIIEEYPSAYTFTIQSSFKYDHPHEEVRNSIKKLQERKTSQPQDMDDEKCIEIIKKYSKEYRIQAVSLAPIINKIAQYVPSRRKRKLHIGLFGYSRDIGGINLPRAITFTSALYSIGLPPEILGLNALNENDLQYIKEIYIHFENDIKDALKYYNPNTRFIPKGLKEKIKFFSDFETDTEHIEITNYIANSIKEDNTKDLDEYVLRAASLRKFLG